MTDVCQRCGGTWAKCPICRQSCDELDLLNHLIRHHTDQLKERLRREGRL